MKNQHLCLTLFALAIGMSTPSPAQTHTQEPAEPAAPISESVRIARKAADPHPDSLTLSPAEPSRFSEPESGAVDHDTYRNTYFGLSYSLPPNWIEGPKGPPPSENGYYVLNFLRPKGDLKGTIQIAAQDLFFSPRPANSTAEMMKDMYASLNDALTANAPPAEVKIGRYTLNRLDYEGAGLHHAILATDDRCHALQFSLTSRDPQMLERMVASLNSLSLTAGVNEGAGKSGSSGDTPVCIKDYAQGANVLHKVDPVMTGPRFTTVPVRLIIGTDGRVRHIHVVNAFPEQAKSVEDALTQWTFKPYLQNGAPVELETGIVFKFPSDADKEKLPPVPEKY